MSEHPKDIEQLDKKIKEIKELQNIGAAKKNVKANKGLEYAFRMITEFVASVFVGFCLGFFIDKLLGIKAIFMIIFALFGLVAGMRSVYLTAKEIEEKMEKE